MTSDRALEEALCCGWIDGSVRRRDQGTYLQRFTPRWARSLWSQRNVGLVARLSQEGRMRPAGLAEVARAQADGRWQAAYPGPATITVPNDLAAALDAAPAARAAFEVLNRQGRYSVLHLIVTATRPETRARRLARHVEALARGAATDPRQRGPRADL